MSSLLRNGELIYSRKYPTNLDFGSGEYQHTYSFLLLSLSFSLQIWHQLLAFFKKMMNLNFSIPLDGISTIPFMLIIYIPLFLIIELLQEDYDHLSLKLSGKMRGNKKEGF